ncbi:conserved Plasmodium protein, unknown function [Plasmodium vinckei lentum]|uniref:Uncharacterized protein n=1 Tax=Plasmodium vinckei lentum TaxID=138297 RepID=A0A6V7S4X1_PLAVN|nr:conserved Plasmodium protein, unknown function [Plasmodium vinckei lentum]
MECFLFDSFTLPTINTFIILDTIIKVLKKKEKGKWREGKKILYLGNKILIDTFPPNYNFILNFLNVLIENKNKTSDYINNNVCKNDDSCENKSVWDVKKVKDYKKGNIKETNYFNIKGNLHITMKELKSILKNIHIKYVDNEIHLSNLLYKLNKDKKYNLIIINLAFFFFKDKLKLNSFIQGMSHFTTNFTPTNKNNITSLGNTNSFNFSLTSKQTHIDSFLQKEICDDQFLKNIMNIHFQYSFFVNFFEHLNSVDNFFVLSKKKKYKNEWRAPQINDMNIKDDKNEINNNISSSYCSNSSNSEQREDRIKDANPLYYESSLINHNKLVSCRKRSYTENISINIEKKKMKKNLYIFDMFPKSESYKKMYMNMISLYFNYVYLIS